MQRNCFESATKNSITKHGTHTAMAVDLNKHYAASGQQAGENKMSTSNITISNANRLDA